MFNDLRDYMKTLEKNKQLLIIDDSVDAELEIANIADKLVKRGGPAALFTNVKNSRIPVLVNMFGTEKRTAFSMGLKNFDELGKRLSSYVDTLPPSDLVEKLKLVNKFSKIRKFLPVKVKNAPCQEIVIDKGPMLDLLPVLKCWPGDGGRFITLPMVFTKNPENGIQNCGMYRMQVFSNTSTGMHFHKQKDGMEHLRKTGKKLEVAVAIGCDPAIIYASTAPLPPDVDEMILAAFIRGKAVEMVKGKFTDLMVPANAEIILEGEIDPSETKLEGPFGDHTGYYSGADYFPVFRLKGMTMRRNPVYPATVVGPPPMEDCYLGKLTERLFLPVLKKMIPEIIDIDMPVEGIFHNFLIVAIRKTYAGQARKVMMSLWGMGQMMFTKCILIVDEDVNIHDYRELFWQSLNSIDPDRDTMIVEGPADCLDHASSRKDTGSKIGIDATRKLSEEGYNGKWPDRLEMNREIEIRTERILRDAVSKEY